MKKIPFLAISAILVFSLCFSSCDGFFGSSWGSNRKYDASKISLDLGNLDQWVEAAVGNPDLADALTEVIKEKVKKSNGKEKGRYQEAGIKVAVESTGVGTSILTNGLDALADLVNEDYESEEKLIKDLLSSILDDFNANDGPQAAEDIAEMLEITTQSLAYVPTLPLDYLEFAKPGDVAQAILILVLAELSNEELELDNLKNYFENITSGLSYDEPPFPGKIQADSSASETAVVLAACFNFLIDSDGSIISDALLAAFGIDI